MKRFDSEGKIVKKIYSTIILLFVFIGLISTSVQAKFPKPIFDRPVQLDDSGRPLYNSWERQEYLRKQRTRQKQLQQQKEPVEQPEQENQASQAKSSQPGNDDNVQEKKADVKGESGTVSEEQTPSSAVINRPMRNK